MVNLYRLAVTLSCFVEKVKSLSRCFELSEKFSFFCRNVKGWVEPRSVRKKRLTYLTLVNLTVFCFFLLSLWLCAFNSAALVQWGIGRVELEMVMLQSVSFLLFVCAAQMSTKAAVGWRPVLLTFAFIALSESSLVALRSKGS